MLIQMIKENEMPCCLGVRSSPIHASIDKSMYSDFPRIKILNNKEEAYTSKYMSKYSSNSQMLIDGIDQETCLLIIPSANTGCNQCNVLQSL